jgi:hypothetical protein
LIKEMHRLRQIGDLGMFSLSHPARKGRVKKEKMSKLIL